MKKAFFINLLIFSLFFGSTIAKAQKLYAIFVIDNVNTKFKKYGIKAEARMYDFANNFAKYGKLNFDYKSFKNKGFEADSVLNYIKNLNTTHNDIILFLYSGQSSFDAKNKERFPNLLLKNYQKKPLSFDQLANQIGSKPTKFAVAILDSPSKVPHGVSENEEVTGVTINRSLENIEKIIKNTSGLIKISSAKRGEPSYIINSRKRDLVNPKVTVNELNSLFILAFNAAVNTVNMRKQTEALSFIDYINLPYPQGAQSLINQKLVELKIAIPQNIEVEIIPNKSNN